LNQHFCHFDQREKSSPAPTMMVSQKVKNGCHFERQREIFLLNQLVLNVINLTKDFPTTIPE